MIAAVQESIRPNQAEHTPTKLKALPQHFLQQICAPLLHQLKDLQRKKDLRQALCCCGHSHPLSRCSSERALWICIRSDMKDPAHMHPEGAKERT